MNKQLLAAYNKRRVDAHPKKWEIWGMFQCIDEKGKKIDGAIFGPLGKIKVNDEYSDIEFGEIAQALGKQADRAKEVLGR